MGWPRWSGRWLVGWLPSGRRAAGRRGPPSAARPGSGPARRPAGKAARPAPGGVRRPARLLRRAPRSARRAPGKPVPGGASLAGSTPGRNGAGRAKRAPVRSTADRKPRQGSRRAGSVRARTGPCRRLSGGAGCRLRRLPARARPSQPCGPRRRSPRPRPGPSRRRW